MRPSCLSYMLVGLYSPARYMNEISIFLKICNQLEFETTALTLHRCAPSHTPQDRIILLKPAKLQVHPVHQFTMQNAADCYTKDAQWASGKV